MTASRRNDRRATAAGAQAEDGSAGAGRLARLLDSGLLDSDREVAFDRYTQLAARVVGAPVALVSLVTDTRQFFKSDVGLPEPYCSLRETPLSHSFCQHVLQGEPLVVPDARLHEVLRHNRAVTDLSVIAYAGYPITNARGDVYGALCVIDRRARQWSRDELANLEDIAASVSTEIRMKEQVREERETRARVEAAMAELSALDDRIRGQLEVQQQTTAFVSHDLRTPLHTIMLGLQMLQLHPRLPREMQASIGPMRDAVRQMDGLLGDLLDALRMSADAGNVQLAPVDTGELFRRLEGLFRERVRERQLELRFVGPAVRVQCDERRLIQALGNLLENAMRVTPPGGCLQVSVSADASGTHFSVDDEGPGIDGDGLARVTSRFSQGDSPGKAGLGLAIVTSVAEGHGGVLTAHPRPDVTRGSRLTISLPCPPLDG